MRDIIIVKDIKEGVSRSLLLDLKNLFINSHWTIVILSIFSIIVFELLIKKSVFLTLPNYFQAIMCSLFSFWIIFFGYTLSRDYKLNVTSNLQILMGDTLLNMLSFPYLKPIRFLGGLSLGALTPYVLEKVNVLSYYPEQMVPTPAMLGMCVFIIFSGILSLSSQDIFMNWDGLVKSQDKNGIYPVPVVYNSKEKTDDVVKNYRKLNRKVNFNSATLFTILMLAVVIIMLNHLLLPIFLIFFAMVLNFLYSYSFTKTVAQQNYNGPWVLTNELSEKIDENEEQDDINIKSEEEAVKEIEKTKKIKETFTKENILGEDWYLNDRKSVIADEVDEDIKAENGENEEDDNNPSPSPKATFP